MPRQPQIRLVRNESSINPINVLEGVALNAAAATRTAEINCEGYSVLRFFVFFTHSAASDVSVTPTATLDGTNYAPLQSRSIVAGAATLSDLVDTKTVTGDDQFWVDYDVRGLTTIKLAMSGTSAGASDLVTCQGCLIAEG